MIILVSFDPDLQHTVPSTINHQPFLPNPILGALGSTIESRTDEKFSMIQTKNPAIARKCVLIIEDDPLSMKIFNTMIAAEGYHVLQATDGARGLEQRGID